MVLSEDIQLTSDGAFFITRYLVAFL